jgi:hypothetical protein
MDFCCVKTLKADAPVFVPAVAKTFLDEHIKKAEAKDARIAELEALCAAKDDEITKLQVNCEFVKVRSDAQAKENAELKAKLELIEQELQDCISAHAGDATMDADQVVAQTKFAVANVVPCERTEWDKVLHKANKFGLVKPMYKNVDLDKKPGAGNGEPVLDRNDMKECLSKAVPIFTMDNRAPEGMENIPENRRRTYVPYAEIEEDQKEFEKLWPKFTQHRDSAFKNVSRDPRCDKRSTPRGRK